MLGAVSLLLGVPSPAHAQTVMWVGGGGDNFWSTSENWDTGTAPANDSTVSIDFNGITRPTPITNAPWNISGLTFNYDAAAFTLAGSALTIGSGGINSSSMSNQTVNNAINLSTAQTWSSTAGNLTAGGNVNLGGSLLTVDTSGFVITITGQISGAGALTVVDNGGSGRLVLSGTNIFMGGTSVYSGVLSIAADSALGQASGILTLDGGTLQTSAAVNSARGITLGDYNGGGVIDVDGQASTFTGPITGGGLLYVKNTGSEGGTLTLSGANTYRGGTSIDGSSGSVTLKAGAANVFSVGPLDGNSGSTLDLNGYNQSIDSLNINEGGVLDLNGAQLTVGAGNNGSNFNGIIADTFGGGSFVKIGTGDFTMTGPSASTYTGSTTVNGGTLGLNFSAMGTPTNLLSASSALIMGGGTLNVSGNGSVTSEQTFAATTFNSGAAAITVNSDSGPTVNLHLGVITRSPGASVNFTLPASGNITTTSGNTNDILGGWATVGGTDWAAVSSGNIAAATYTDEAWGAGNNTNITTSGAPSEGATTNSLRFNTAGAATLTLSGINTVTSGGILVTPTVGVDATTITGGTLQASSGSDLVVIQNNPSGMLVIASAIAGDAGLTKSGGGALVLSGSNSYIGGTRINAGALSIGNDSALGDTSGSLTIDGGALQTTADVTLSSGRTFTIGVNGAAIDVFGNSSGYAGTIAGAGGLAVIDRSGGGTFTLAGANTYSGGTTVDGSYGSVTLVAGATNALGSGPLLVNGGGNTATINFNGYDQTVASLEGVNDGRINLGSALLTIDNASSIEFSGTISGSGSLVKTGSGMFALNSSGVGYLNAYTGGTSVNAGVLGIGSDTDLGDSSGPLTLNSGTILFNGDINSTRDITLGTSGMVDVYGSTSEFGGKLTGTGALRIKDTNGAGMLTLTNSANDYSGGTIIDGTYGDVTLMAGATGVFGPGRMTLNGKDYSATLDLGYNSQAIGSLAGDASGAINLYSSQLTVGSDNTSSVFAGNISDNSEGGSLIKTGTGVLTLSGSIDYTGGTTISGGTLIANGGLGGGDVTVATGGTLGGGGSFNGLATFQSGAHLAPGNSPGTITFTSLTLEAGSILDLQLGAISDLIVVSGGDLTGPASGSITLNLSNAGGFTAATYVLFDFTGATNVYSFDATDFALGSTMAGYEFSLALNGSTLELIATATAVPEPATYAVLAGLAVLGLAMGRRRSAG